MIKTFESHHLEQNCITTLNKREESKYLAHYYSCVLSKGGCPFSITAPSVLTLLGMHAGGGWVGVMHGFKAVK